MATAIGIWSAIVKPGEPFEFVPAADLRIINVSLGETLSDESGRSVLKMTFNDPAGASLSDDEDEDEDEDEEPKEPSPVTTVICALTPGKIEQATTNLIVLDQEEYIFEVVGKNSLYLTGNYIDQSSGGSDYPPGFDDSDSDDEADYDLREVSSDVEMNAEDLDGIDSDASRFEEVGEEPKSLKRAREEDATPAKESKAEKKARKKAKAADGSAVTPAETPVKDTTTAKKDKKEDKKEDKQEDKKEKGTKEQTLPGNIKYVDATVGSGPTAKPGNVLRMRYIGKLANGKIFDSNTKGKPFSFTLGKGQVIKGWDQGIAGMQVGGERVLTIPPAAAYGKKGSPPTIPGNSTLTFEVKLLEIK